MAGLKLKLRQYERVMINGVIIQNGDKTIEITVETQAKILRLRDAIHPSEANTPVKRVCYIAQLAVAGEVSDEDSLPQFIDGVKALLKVFLDEGSQKVMKFAIEHASEHNFYKAMQVMRKLIPYEEALFLKFEQATKNQIKHTDDSIASAYSLKELHDKLSMEQSKTA